MPSGRRSPPPVSTSAALMADPRPPARVRVERFGDAALLVVLGERVDAELNARVHRLAAAVRERGDAMPGLGAPVPGYASLLVTFDPLVLAESAARAVIAEMLAAPAGPAVADADPPVTIRVRYGGADGPDLAAVAQWTGLSQGDVIDLHAGTEYTVFVVGFVPGFPYLGVLPAELALPRRATPRLRVPRGSVAIAGRQTGIYPVETPGGWHVLGRTDAAMWDPRRPSPALLGPGCRVRFVPA